MRSRITFIVAVTVIALGVICVVQSHKSVTQQRQVASLQGDLAAKSRQIEELQAAEKRLEEQRREAAFQAEESAAQLKASQFAKNIATVVPRVPTEPAAVAESEKAAEEKGGLGKMLAKMMQDPDTREMIRTQQRMMMDQMYAPLVKQMGLTPEEAKQFKDLLADNMM